MTAAAGEFDLLDLPARERLALNVSNATDDMHEAVICARLAARAQVAANNAASAAESATQASNAQHVADKAAGLVQKIARGLEVARSLAEVRDRASTLIVQAISNCRDAATLAAQEAQASAAAAGSSAARRSREALDAFPVSRAK